MIIMAFLSGRAGVTLNKSWGWVGFQLDPGCLEDRIHRTKERRRSRLIGLYWLYFFLTLWFSTGVFQRVGIIILVRRSRSNTKGVLGMYWDPERQISHPGCLGDEIYRTKREEGADWLVVLLTFIVLHGCYIQVHLMMGYIRQRREGGAD